MKSRVFQFVTVGVYLSAATLFAAPAPENAPMPPADTRHSESDSSSDDSRSVASPAEITAWIIELADGHYLVREQATRRLLTAGSPALDPLLAAANGDEMERADRAIEILRRFSAAKDPVFRRQALERLVNVKIRPRVSAVASEALAVLRHEEAVAAIEKLGGRFKSSPFGGIQSSKSPYMTVCVIIDSQWKGGDGGLAHLGDLIGLRHVVVVGSDISLSGLSELQKVVRLEDLWLYGTKLDGEDVAKVQALLPQVSLDYRRGGLLGVGGTTIDDVGPAVVGTVQKGSAAEGAGMMPGDVIQQFNGQPVGTFKELTAKIGQLRAGEEVKLEVLRGGQPMSFTLKLGQWQTI